MELLDRCEGVSYGAGMSWICQCGQENEEKREYCVSCRESCTERRLTLVPHAPGHIRWVKGFEPPAPYMDHPTGTDG